MDQLDRRLRQLGLGPCRQLRLDDIAGNQHRPHPPPAGAADIGGDKALLRRHQPHDRAMLAVAAQRADDGWVSLLIRADGNSRRAGAPSPC